MITADLVQDWMYRGSNFTLVAHILQEEGDDPFEIPSEAVAHLRLAVSSASPESVLEIEASDYSREIGLVRFDFVPEDTIDLIASGYDLTIHIIDGTNVYPAYKGKFALKEFNPEVTGEIDSRRSVETLLRRVREELRAEGADGGGYSDFIILEGLNAALEDLSGIFPIRDITEFTTEDDENSYELNEVLPLEILNIIRVEYDGKRTTGTQIDSFMDVTVPKEGPVREWFLWGKKLIFTGKVEAGKTVKLWITRAPHRLAERGDVPETPSYTDEAIVAYAVSICYRESKDYDRANYHYSIYMGQKNELLKRSVPQSQKDTQSIMRDSYMGPFRARRGFIRSDTDPGGSYRG